MNHEVSKGEKHAHKCLECEMVFRHAEPPEGLTSEEYAKRHHCPNCGAGPFFMRYSKGLTNEELRKAESAGKRISETLDYVMDKLTAKEFAMMTMRIADGAPNLRRLLLKALQEMEESRSDEELKEAA